MSMIYFKPSSNHWWDAYSNQDKVLIDELPKEASKWIMNYLKKWADKLPLILEYKGGTTYARYTHLIVTCQHSITEFFSSNGVLQIPEADLAAIKERYTETHVPLRLYWLIMHRHNELMRRSRIRKLLVLHGIRCQVMYRKLRISICLFRFVLNQRMFQCLRWLLWLCGVLDNHWIDTLVFHLNKPNGLHHCF